MDCLGSPPSDGPRQGVGRGSRGDSIPGVQCGPKIVGPGTPRFAISTWVVLCSLRAVLHTPGKPGGRGIRSETRRIVRAVHTVVECFPSTEGAAVRNLIAAIRYTPAGYVRQMPSSLSWMASALQEVAVLGVRIAVMAGYLAVLLAIGLLARNRRRRSADDYFLASRTLPGWVLFLTMAATNFSAFTAFGVAGAGWRSGYAFYPIMAFGTGFMALTFAIIGRPVWHLGKQHGLITPPELVFQRTRSPALRLVFFVVMTLFTLPYLAMQPMAAGYALESLLGLPYFAGAALITAIMLAYTFLGGFRGVAWTDVFQGGMLVVLMGAALVAIAAPLGGVAAANRTAAAALPALFSRPGLDQAFGPGIWFGYMLLWFFCDPMFPQLFQRFYAARTPRALATTMGLYPLVTGLVFLFPVAIGVIGRVSFPTLPPGTTSDQILPLLLRSHASPVLEALVLTAALAALMSTLDSQLLTLSSMFARDVVGPFWARRRRTSEGEPLPEWMGKAFVVALAVSGLVIAYRPPATFVEIATETFTGLAVLFPVVVGAIYWPRMNARAAIAAILVGESLVGAYHVQALPTFGTLPVVPVVLATSFVLVAGSWLFPTRIRDRADRSWPPMGRRATLGWALATALLFVLGNDIWAWKSQQTGWLGFPIWIWWCFAVCLLLAIAFAALGRQRGFAAAGSGLGSRISRGGSILDPRPDPEG